MQTILEVRQITLASHTEHNALLQGMGRDLRLLAGQAPVPRGLKAIEPANNPNLTSQAAQQHLVAPAGNLPWDDTITIDAAYRMECDNSCHCQCHGRRVTKSSPSWLKGLAGSFFLNYDALPVFDTRKCNVARCRNSGTDLELRYFFPTWACLRGILFSMNTASAFGRGARISLEIPKYFGAEHELFSEWNDISFESIANILCRDQITLRDSFIGSQSIFHVRMRYGTSS